MIHSNVFSLILDLNHYIMYYTEFRTQKVGTNFIIITVSLLGVETIKMNIK